MSSDLEKIDGLSEKIEICTPGAVQMAKAIYSQAEEEDFTRGRVPHIVQAAVLYAGCKSEGLPITSEEVAHSFGISEKRLLRTFRKLKRDLSLEVGPPSVEVYIERFIEELETEDDEYEELEELSKDIVKACYDKEIIPGSPTGFAASAIYAAGVIEDWDLTQDDVSEASGVTTVTIRNWYKKQLEAYRENLEKDGGK